jgi:ABC-type branched-subunit amino acid transport system substrate-binding protein
MKRPLLRFVGLLSVPVLVLSGVATSGASARESTQSGGAARGVTATAITIGGLADLTSFAGTDVGVKARFERANREGPINGRRINFIGVKDDGGDSARNLTLVRELVQKDNVFAVVPVISQGFLPQSSDFLAQNTTPFSGWGFQPGFCGNKYGYGFNGCLIGPDFLNTSLIDATIKASGKKASKLRFAFQGETGPAGIEGNKAFAKIAKKRGAKVVYQEANIPLEQPTADYTPYVQAILATNPNVIYDAMGFQNTAGLAGALNAAGYKGIVLSFADYVPGLLEVQPQLAQAISGNFIQTQIVPAESNSPAIKQIKKDLRAIGAPPAVTLGGEVGYWAADQMVQMLQAAGKNLTAKTFQRAMNKAGFTYKPPPGGVGPVSFPKAHTAPTPCSAVVKVVGTTYKQVAAFKCYEVLPNK